MMYVLTRSGVKIPNPDTPHGFWREPVNCHVGETGYPRGYPGWRKVMDAPAPGPYMRRTTLASEGDAGTAWERVWNWEPIPLAEYKADRIAANRAESQDRILAKWPDWRQRNAGLGQYSASVVGQLNSWITGHVAAENAAADAIEAASDYAGVDAVTVQWPEAE